MTAMFINEYGFEVAHHPIAMIFSHLCDPRSLHTETTDPPGRFEDHLLQRRERDPRAGPLWHQLPGGVHALGDLSDLLPRHGPRGPRGGDRLEYGEWGKRGKKGHSR